jgi:hypothetical protein
MSGDDGGGDGALGARISRRRKLCRAVRVAGRPCAGLVARSAAEEAPAGTWSFLLHQRTRADD